MADCNPDHINGRSDERSDALAYLTRKIANAQKIIATNNDRDGSTAAMKRAWEIMRDDIGAGLHLGAAAVAETIAAGDS